MADNQAQKAAGPKGGAQAWFIWSLAAIAFGYAFFHRIAPSVMVSELMGDFAIGGAVLGTLSALYFYPYVLLQIPLGGILDVVGTRYLLSTAVAIAAAGSIIFGVAGSIEMAYLGRILIGVGCSVGFLGSLTLAANWFPAHRFSFLAGLSMFFGMMSGMLAQAPLAIIVDTFSWRDGMWGLGIFGALLAIMILIFVRNQPLIKQMSGQMNGQTAQSKPQPNKPRSSMRKTLLAAASSLEVWKVAFVAAAMSGPMLTLGGLWGTPYLMVAYNMERPQAAFLMSLMLLGWAFGAPTSGWLIDRFGRKKQFLIGACTVLVLALLLVVFLPQPPHWLTVSLFIVAGISGAVMTATFALARENSPPEITGSVTGIVNSMTVASGAVLQPFVGLLLDYMWDGKLVDGARIYRATDFQWSFSIILLSALIGLILALRLKETPYQHPAEN